MIAATNMSPERRVSWPDDDRAAWPGEALGGRAPEGERERRLEVDVGDAADAVGAEQPGHAGLALVLGAVTPVRGTATVLGTPAGR